MHNFHPPSNPAKHARNSHQNLRRAKMHPHTLPRPPAKGDEVFLQTRSGSSEGKPAFGFEGTRIREDRWVIVNQRTAHADRCPRRQSVVVVLNRLVRADTLQAVRHAVADTENLEPYRADV